MSVPAAPAAFSRRAPLLVMALILLLSTTAALVISAFVRAQQQSRFGREVQAYTLALRDRMNDYDRLLRTARAAWQIHPDLLNEAAFARFVDATDLARRYPGVQALGFGTWVPDGDTRRLVERLRVTVRPDYTVTEGPSPARARAPIAVIAPASPENLGALGYDLYSEPRRRAALDLARRRDDVQASVRVPLLQHDEAGQPLAGFLLTLPVWPEGTAGDAADAGRTVRQPQGFIYMAVRADQFLASLDQPLLPGLGIRASLGGELLSATPDPGPSAFSNRLRLTLAGQPWTLEYSAARQFGADAAAAVPVLTLLAGLLIAGLAYLLVQSQVIARNRAEALNVSLGQARLRQEQARAEFEAIFQSMQDAAVFTDVQGRVRLVNRALTRQFGYAPQELIGQPLSRLHAGTPPGDSPGPGAATTLYRRRDGSTFSGEVQRSAVQDGAGEQLGQLEVVRDVTAQLAAQRALQAGEARYRGVLDAIPHLLQVSDPHGQVTYVNAQHHELLGDDDLSARVWPEDRPAFERLWREARACDGHAAGARGARAELRLTVGEGEGRYFMLRVAPRLGDAGEVSEWVTSATDIHDRRLAEQLAQRNEERYRGVLESLPQIVWLTDPQGTPFYFNRRWEEYVGPARATAGFLGQLHPDDRAGYQQRWAAAIRTLRPFEAEHRLLSAAGAYRSFVTRGLPVLDAAGQVVEWVGTSTDVDDSVYEENAARLLADVSQDLGARGHDGQAARAGQYRRALGRLTARFVDSAAVWQAPPPSEGQPPLLAASSLHPAWQSEHMRAFLDGALARVIGSEDPLFVTAHPLLHGVRATGALFYPLLDRRGGLCGVLGVFYRQAMTARDQDLAQELAKRFASALEADALQAQVLRAQHDLQSLNQSLEERVQRRTEELEGANRELEAFSYSVSHDLRTPLRHIVGFGDLLGKEAAAGGLSGKGQRYLGIITDSATRMSQLIDDLLEFSRMGRQELRRESVDLRALLGSSWAALEPDRQGREITLTLPPPDALPAVRGDPALLGLVLTNLLSNAVKYTRMREHAEISVGAVVTGGAAGGEVTLTVRDNGVGFDPRYVDKLFGVFQRLHRADEFEGIGIGLANVRRIVVRHGGRVHADARPNEGAAFSVTLPVDGPPPARPAPDGSSLAGRS